MALEDDELLEAFVAETTKSIADLETDVRALAASEADVDPERVTTVLRTIGSMKQTAGSCGLGRVEALADEMQRILELARDRELIPSPDVIDVLLRATARLSDMVGDVPDADDVLSWTLERELQAITGSDATDADDAPVEGDEASAPVAVQTPAAWEIDDDEGAVDVCRRDGSDAFLMVPTGWLNEHRRAGRSIHLLAIDLLAQDIREDRRPADIIGSMDEHGAILQSYVRLGPIPPLETTAAEELTLLALYASEVSADLLPSVLLLPEESCVLLADGASVDPVAPVIEDAETPPTVDDDPLVHDDEPDTDGPLAGEEEQLDALIEESPIPAKFLDDEPAGIMVAVETPIEPAHDADTKAAPPSAPPAPAFPQVELDDLDALTRITEALVHARNQLNHAATGGPTEDAGETVDTIAARIDRLTSELRHAITRTRRQPVGLLFAAFPHLVQSEATRLGTSIELEIHGEDVALDASIIEAIRDPLTHLVRHACAHGVETPGEPADDGRSESRTLRLRAFHQDGVAFIQLEDDGPGGSMDPALDGVRASIEAIGGVIDITPAPDSGSAFRIQLPPAPDVIPSLIITQDDTRYAIPQSSISEWVRVRPQDVPDRLGRINEVDVLRWRGTLLPLIDLGHLVDEHRPDDAFAGPPEATSDDENDAPELTASSMAGVQRPVHIIVIEAGTLRYGLIVDAVATLQEIVARPLGRHLQSCRILRGVSVLGDGHAGLILDLTGVAVAGRLFERLDRVPSRQPDDHEAVPGIEADACLLFTNHDAETFAVPTACIRRIERLPADAIDSPDGHELVQDEGPALPLVSLEQHLDAPPRPDLGHLHVVVVRVGDTDLGLIAPRLVDLRGLPVEIDRTGELAPGVIGSVVADGRSIRVLDPDALGRTAFPDRFADPSPVANTPDRKTILVAETSNFLRRQVTSLLASEDHEVIGCEDGQLAWQILQDPDRRVDMLITGIEMPNMDGHELTRTIRADAMFAHLPVIAISSCAGEEHIRKATDAGVNAFQSTIDRESLLADVRSLMEQSAERGGLDDDRLRPGSREMNEHPFVEPAAATATGAAFLSVHLGDQWIGVDLHRVHEVVRLRSLTPVPHAPAFVRGVAPLRDEVVVMVDLRRILGLGTRPIDGETRGVIVRSESELIGLIADRIGDVVSADEDPIEPGPGDVAGPIAAFVDRIHTTSDARLCILDLDAVLAAGMSETAG